MGTRYTKQAAGPAAAEALRESGQPGGGQGRVDTVGRSGVYPGSGPYPGGPARLRTPAEFVHGQTDAEGRPVEGGSELTYFQGQTLLGGATPPSSGAAEPARPGTARPPKSQRRRARPVRPRGNRTGKRARRAKRSDS